MEVHRSAGKHGVPASDVLHAFEHDRVGRSGAASGPTQGPRHRAGPRRDADIDALADEVTTTDDDTETLKGRRRGRPLLGSAPGEVVPVRLDPELRAAIEARAEADDTNSSEIIRRALRAYLAVA